MYVLLVYFLILLGAAVITHLAFGEDGHKRVPKGCGLDYFFPYDAKDTESEGEIKTTKLPTNVDISPSTEEGLFLGAAFKDPTRRVFSEENTIAALKDMPLDQLRMLSFLEDTCCVLPVRGADVHVLHHPTAFYDEMRSQIRAARHSIVLSALYLSHGPLSQEFVACLEEKFHEMARLWEQQRSCSSNGVVERCEPFTITLLMDYNRMHSKRDLATVQRLLNMADAVKAYEGADAGTLARPQIHVYLYQSPCKWNNVFAPFGRAKEALGVQHTKIFCFDGRHTLLTGANLSDDYFATRIDRYVVFTHHPLLTAWFTRLVETLCALSHPVLRQGDAPTPSLSSLTASSSSSSLLGAFFGVASWWAGLQSGGGREGERRGASTALHAREGLVVGPNATGLDASAQPEAFARAMQGRLRAFARNAARDFAGSAAVAFGQADSPYDSLFFPTLQCGRAGIFHDSAVVKTLFSMTTPADHVFLASPYLNLHIEFVEEFLHRDLRLDCITASVKSNGWNGQRGIAGFIPFFYLQLERSFYYLMKAYNRVHRVHLHEFSMQSLTFHAKGVWFASDSPKGGRSGGDHTTFANGSASAGIRDIAAPYLTEYGSTNYGYRSVYKDLEAGGFLFTLNQSLRESIKQELQSLLQHSTPVSEEQFVGTAMGRFQPVISLLAQMGQYFL